MEVPLELDTQKPDIAYRCGRLFAVLEKAQEESAEDATKAKLNSTIKDKYFGAATARPLLVLPRLFVLNSHHVRKLSRPGRKQTFDMLLQQILSVAPFEFPRQLDLAGQGQFIVGYFQQRQDFFKSRKAEGTEPLDKESTYE